MEYVNENQDTLLSKLGKWVAILIVGTFLAVGFWGLVFHAIDKTEELRIERMKESGHYGV